MKSSLSPLIDTSDLQKIHKSENVIIVDASNHKDARSNYEDSHLEGAIFVDVNTDLAEINSDLSKGGRHPLPQIENFAKTLGKLGISPQSHVIIYDDKNGSNAAARFWWMLKAIGHENVQVLNGGFQEALKHNFPTSSKTESISPKGEYKVDSWQLKTVTMDEVERVSQSKNEIVIDVRENKRYRGEIEPIDLIAGHIPGSINIPFTENLDENGLFLNPSEIKEKYQKIFKNVDSKNIIVHCGSGVTACHTLLALAHAGLEIPKLYVGSWSEWSRNGKTVIKENS